MIPRPGRRPPESPAIGYALAATRSRPDLVDALSRHLPRAGLEGVLGDLDRTAEPCPVPGAAAGAGYTWDGDDREDPAWWPQGIASIRSGDVLLVSWYARRRGFHPGAGSRISVLDRTDPTGPRYRHVLLVAPHRRLGVVGMSAVRVHAGGIAVHGDVLHVADTFFGVRLFRLADVLRVPRGRGHAAGGSAHRGIDRLGGSLRGFGASGYDYVLPQLMALRVPLTTGTRRLRHSFLSIGRLDGRPNLVVGEYRRAADAPPRLVRYPLDGAGGLPPVDRSGRLLPFEVHENQPRRMQGAAVHDSTWYVTASSGAGVNGDLYVGAPGAWVRSRGVLPPGPEDLDWSRPGEELWSVSEWPGQRWIFPVATDRRRWRAESTRSDRP